MMSYFNCFSFLSLVSISLLIFPRTRLVSSLDSGVSTSHDWRCGIFLIPNADSSSNTGVAIDNEPTRVWTFPTKFKTSCVFPIPNSYNQTCYELMKHSFRQWSYTQPSQADSKSGKSIGDDFCNLIGHDELQGREVGFFFNYCGRDDWTDTTLRRGEKVCCRDGKYVSCQLSNSSSTR